MSAASFNLFSESAAFFSSVGAALIFFASVFWIKPKNEVGSKGQRPFNPPPSLPFKQDNNNRNNNNNQ
ncbi:MAG: hypothetical protein PHX50_06295 [Massilibacteroides sp.]|nr:hypothetical protein [Massilibacteroides sp.]